MANKHFPNQKRNNEFYCEIILKKTKKVVRWIWFQFEMFGDKINISHDLQNMLKKTETNSIHVPMNANEE